jgi:hypothetical protein
VQQCDEQKGTSEFTFSWRLIMHRLMQCCVRLEQCKSAQSAAAVQDFAVAAPVASTNIGPDPQFPDFDLICEG